MRCPDCNGFSISTERKPNGNSTCNICGFSAPTKHFEPTKFIVSYFDLSCIDNPINKLYTEAYKEAAKQTETTLLTQLNELIKRGLLVVEEQHPVLVSSFHSADQAGIEVRMDRSVKLVLKDQEYVEKLEKEIEELSNKNLELQETFDNLKIMFDNLTDKK